ncbi:hypothetical protein M8J77_017385 [Diaphorina citri]|nr:hypothetical protein M8J77_017385 [Diaphorina citri]
MLFLESPESYTRTTKEVTLMQEKFHTVVPTPNIPSAFNFNEQYFRETERDAEKSKAHKSSGIIKCSDPFL